MRRLRRSLRLPYVQLLLPVDTVLRGRFTWYDAQMDSAQPKPEAAASSAPHAAHTDAVPLNSATATTASSVASDASVARFAEVAPIGERRNIADVLIENARLLAVSEGKDRIIDEKNEQISELRDDRAFLRDEIREARRNRDDVKNIAERMLDTLKSMALGRLGMTDVTTSAPEHRQSTTVNPGSQS